MCSFSHFVENTTFLSCKVFSKISNSVSNVLLGNRLLTLFLEPDSSLFYFSGHVEDLSEQSEADGSSTLHDITKGWFIQPKPLWALFYLTYLDK